MTDEIGNVEDVETGATELEPAIGDEITMDDAGLEEYSPNFTYKVKDEEHEFNDYVKGAITSRESEDYFRDLHTRADGLDGYKEKVTGLEGRLGEYENVTGKLQRGFTDLKSYRDQGDYRNLFKSLGVSSDDVVKYAYGLAQEAEMPEEQRNMINQNRQYEDRLSMLERENESHRQHRSNSAVNNDLKELESYVNTSDGLNDRMKSVGFNLRDEILSYGIAATKSTGREPSIAEAANVVIEKYGKLLSPANAGIPQTREEQVQQVINNRPNALPKINGSNQTAPSEKMTMEKLRALSAKIS